MLPNAVSSTLIPQKVLAEDSCQNLPTLYHMHISTVTGTCLKEPLSRVSKQSGQPVTRKVFRRDLEVPPYHSGWQARLGWTAHSVPLVLTGGGLDNLYHVFQAEGT